uniref:Uncharacterized protein n=1 Tax=Trichogramma kaykai TaxID=54128 RepID=A0ABD2WZ87_9HYME
MLETGIIETSESSYRSNIFLVPKPPDKEGNKSNLAQINEIAREKLVAAKLRAKYYYDKKVNEINFKVGDSVWLLRGGKKKKLEDQYTGPYTIIETFKNKPHVKIELKKNKHSIVHSNRLRLSKINPNDEHV